MSYRNATPEETKEKMNEAAQKAERELLKLMSSILPADLDAIAAWYKNNYLGAGYKRLTQVLWKHANYQYQDFWEQ